MMNSKRSRQAPASGRSRARLILPIAGTGLLIACIVVITLSLRPTIGESDILRSIYSIALSKSQKPGVPDGGPFGPWWISASRLDPISGTLHDFSITSDTIIIAAESARIEVDAFENTFSIDMNTVVLTRLPGEAPDEVEQQLVKFDHYRLGPASFDVDILPDAGRLPPIEPGPSAEPSPLAGIQPSRQ